MKNTYYFDEERILTAKDVYKQRMNQRYDSFKISPIEFIDHIRVCRAEQTEKCAFQINRIIDTRKERAEFP